MTTEREIEEYNVVYGESHLSLTRNVSAAIRDGWQPFGSIQVVNGGFQGSHEYIQAVVKYGVRFDNKF